MALVSVLRVGVDGYPGWWPQLLTHPVPGLERYQELFARLQNPDGVIKIFCEVTPS